MKILIHVFLFCLNTVDQVLKKILNWQDFLSLLAELALGYGTI